MTSNQPLTHDYVEELRATGFHGREPWVASLEIPLGTALAALREMEICAEQMASVCLDAPINGMDNVAVWELIRLSFFPRFSKLADRLDSSIQSLASHLGSSASPPDDSVLVAWHALKSLNSRLKSEDKQTIECSQIVLPLLFAVIALQSAGHRAVHPNNSGDVSGATHLSPTFLQRCRQRLGWPFQGLPLPPLEQLTASVGALPAPG